MAIQEKNPVSLSGFVARPCGGNTVTPLLGGAPGSVGNIGDRIQRLIVQVANPATALLSILDLNNEYQMIVPAANVPPGPMLIELGMYSQYGPWSVRCGTGCTATAIGAFS